MKAVKFFALVLILVSVSFGREIDFLPQFEVLARASYGKEYSSEATLFSASPSYQSFVQLLQKRKQYTKGSGHKKKGVAGLDYNALFRTLASLSQESKSTLPAYYAFLLMRLSYGYDNPQFNAKYGSLFSQSLASADKCEGYVWLGAVLEHKKSRWKDSANSFKKAMGACTPKTPYYKKAKIEYARMRYLSSDKRRDKR